MFLSMPSGKILSRASENNSHALLGKQGVCIYKRSNPRFPAMPETVGSACWGSTPNPLNSVSRWLRLCEPYHFFKKRDTMKTQKSAGTVRSRRCQSAKKGLGGRSHQQAKREVSAQAVISRFSHLWPQMPCLPLW